MFTSYRANDYGEVQVGNSAVCKVIGMGNIRLQSKFGSLLLKNVKHISELRKNLISGGVLDVEGFGSSIANGKWKLTRGWKTIMIGESVLRSTNLKPRCVQGSGTPRVW